MTRPPAPRRYTCSTKCKSCTYYTTPSISTAPQILSRSIYSVIGLESFVPRQCGRPGGTHSAGHGHGQPTSHRHRSSSTQYRVVRLCLACLEQESIAWSSHASAGHFGVYDSQSASGHCPRHIFLYVRLGCTGQVISTRQGRASKSTAGQARDYVRRNRRRSPPTIASGLQRGFEWM